MPERLIWRSMHISRPRRACRAAGLALAALVGVVGQPHEQGQQHVVGHQRRAAVGHEGQGHAGEGQEADDAAEDDEGLDADQGGEPGGQQLLEGTLLAGRDAQPAADEQQEGRTRMAVVPSSPSSSPMAAKMKSFWASGRRRGRR